MTQLNEGQKGSVRCEGRNGNRGKRQACSRARVGHTQPQGTAAASISAHRCLLCLCPSTNQPNSGQHHCQIPIPNPETSKSYETNRPCRGFTSSSSKVCPYLPPPFSSPNLLYPRPSSQLPRCLGANLGVGLGSSLTQATSSQLLSLVGSTPSSGLSLHSYAQYDWAQDRALVSLA